jgi:large subunit ribosomal protein L4
MPTLDVIDRDRRKVGSLQLSDEVFGEVGSTHVVWEVVRHHLAGRRRGTHATKTRGEVSGTGKKPWRQKGTGRARVGSLRTPLWRHGGTTHGPQPRSYDYPLSRQKRRTATRRVLAAMLRGDRVTVLDRIEVAEPKTRAFKGLLGALGLPEQALVLVEGRDVNLERATSNLSGLKVVQPGGVCTYDLLKYRRLLATEGALNRLAEVLSR